MIPRHFARTSLETFEPRPGTEHAHEYIVGYARGYPAEQAGILLVGPPGVGKTHLVAGIVRHLTLEKGISCMFKDFFLLISEVKEAYDAGRYEADILKPLAEVEVLVVDELGKGRTHSDWEQGLLDEIICKRYNQMKTTILTTNFPLEYPDPRRRPPHGERNMRGGLSSGRSNLADALAQPTLEDRVGKRILSRLRQMCMIFRMEKAADYRLVKGPASRGLS